MKYQDYRAHANLQFVGLCNRPRTVCLSVTIVSLAKTAQPIEMPFD